MTNDRVRPGLQNSCRWLFGPGGQRFLRPMEASCPPEDDLRKCHAYQASHRSPRWRTLTNQHRVGQDAETDQPHRHKTKSALEFSIRCIENSNRRPCINEQRRNPGHNGQPVDDSSQIHWFRQGHDRLPVLKMLLLIESSPELRG